MRQIDYTLLASEPTHIMGALLVHVYIKNNTIFFWQVDTSDAPLSIIQAMMLFL